MILPFEQHLKYIKSQDVYDELMEIKNNDNTYNGITSKEFLLMIYITDCFNHKLKLHEVAKLIPKEYFPILKKQFVRRYTKVYIDWSKIISCPMSDYDPEYANYLWMMKPHRKFQVSVQDS
jgi:hypothetical protein